MSRSDLVKEIIATAAPVFIKKALKYLAAGRPLSEDEISAEVIAECEELPQDQQDLNQSNIISEASDENPRYVGPYGHLVATLCMIIDDLAADIKSQVTQELMMKMHVELEEVKVAMFQAKLDLSSTSRIGTGYELSENNQIFGGIPQFDVTEDVHLDTISAGYSSIEKYAPTAPAAPDTSAPAPAAPTVRTHTAPTAHTTHTAPTIPANLYDNPLFAMVNKSVDRSRAGLSTHTAEDLNAARKNRFTNEEERLKSEAAIINAEVQFYAGIEGANRGMNSGLTVCAESAVCAESTDIDLLSSSAGTNRTVVQDGVSTTGDLWDKMFAERYGSNRGY